MKRRVVVLAAAAFLAVPSLAPAALPGTGQWSFFSRRAGDPNRVQVRLVYAHADAAGVSNGFSSFAVALSDVGLTPERLRAPYVAALGAGGLKTADVDDVLRLADHGVSPRFIEELAKLGYGRLPADDVIRLRDHGVTAGFIGRLQAHGYKNVPAGDLVRLRDSGF